MVAADHSPSHVNVVATNWTMSDKYAGQWALTVVDSVHQRAQLYLENDRFKIYDRCPLLL